MICPHNPLSPALYSFTKLNKPLLLPPSRICDSLEQTLQGPTVLEGYLRSASGLASIGSPSASLAPLASAAGFPFRCPLSDNNNTMNTAGYAHPGILGHSNPQHTPGSNGLDKKPPPAKSVT